MRRSTPGVFSSMEPHTPRVCGPKSKTSFRASSDDSKRCVPPPVPCRNQPPPLPPKHYIRKNAGVEFNKHKEPKEPLDYGKYIYESISDCCGRSAPYESRTFKFSFSNPFPIDSNTDMLKGSCTCSLGTSGGTKPSFTSNNQSPVWSKMPSRPPDSSQSKNHPSSSSICDPPPLPSNEKKSSNVENRPGTLSRFSRTMSRIFRLKGSHHSSKSNSMRSRSVYFTDFPDKFGVNATPEPCSMRAMRSVANSPVVTLPSSPTLPLPPTRKGETGTSTALCHDAVQTIMPSSTELATCSSPTGIPCVHHVHHIHHVHHVHHHLHHLPPPPPANPSLPSASLPLPVSSQPVAPTATTTTDDAAALIMMLESAATLGETPPPISVLKDSKTAATTDQQLVGNAGNSHTYSAYGVRGGMGVNAGPCCSIESVPSQQAVHTTTSTTLHRQNTVCSNPRCITTTTHSCRPHVQGSPCDHLRTPTSIELAELAEAGAEAVFATNGRPTATSSGSFTVEPPHLSSSPPNITTTVTQQHSVNASAPNSPAPGSTGQTHLMHHMHHHHMHHMLHHLRPPSGPTSTPGIEQNTTTATSAQPVPTSTSNQQSSTNTADHRSSFQESMKALRKMGWYWGPLSFTEAEKLLANRPDGTFLVRDSAHDTFFLSLSFRVRGTTYHTRIEHNQGRFSFWFEPESHSASTVVEFIEKAVAHSIGGKYHYFLQTSTPGQQPVEVSLLYPLSRFQVVQSLKHLARFTILSHVRRDHVARLPLPPSQIGYLLEKQVYWESLEDFEEAIRDRPPLQFPLRSSSPQKL
ncbi:unnamed protein product [Hymenolepis diminuta]|uniref:SH2 domain-containing protein n=2 Tax=Hymenolepis diminuta TaxID=6216 RepID=A0A158QEV7_HYMDI|nr:unnamed protein product [Hymenolepis diminuta]VUZ51676.1 unnamed protein product [Hymenolepis diminuta]